MPTVSPECPDAEDQTNVLGHDILGQSQLFRRRVFGWSERLDQKRPADPDESLLLLAAQAVLRAADALQLGF